MFKAGVASPALSYLDCEMTIAERDRLTNDFSESRQPATRSSSGLLPMSGVYEITMENTPRKLALAFADVLYIG